MSECFVGKAAGLLLSAALVTGLMPTAALAASSEGGGTPAALSAANPEATDAAFTYSVADGKATITGYAGPCQSGDPRRD